MDQFVLGANECLGITKTSTKLKILGQSNEIEVAGGEIIKILRLVSLGGCFIKLYSCQKRDLILSHETYSCDHNAIKILSEKLALMLITIGDLNKRLMICNNSDNERFLMNLKLNDLVKVNKIVFKQDYHGVCKVKYIGPVSDIGPGIYIGCTLYDEGDTINEKYKLAAKYFNCKETNGFIRACGCFFTRTSLLDQNIDNLMNIVNASRRKNAHQPKPQFTIPKISSRPPTENILNKTTNIGESHTKLQNNIPVTVISCLKDDILQQPVRPVQNYPKSRASFVEPRKVITETNILKEELNSTHIRPKIQNNFTSTTNTCNEIFPENLYKSVNVYSGIKPSSSHAAETHTVDYPILRVYNTPLIETNIAATPKKKKNRCSLM